MFMEFVSEFKTESEEIKPIFDIKPNIMLTL